MSNPSRERILARIGKALQQKLPPLQVQPRPIFPPIGDLAERFSAECKGNYTECIFTHDAAETRCKLAEVLISVEHGQLFAEDTPEIRGALAGCNGNVVWSSEGRAPESSVATITRAEALIAATGSLLSSSACGGRGGSIVAPVHIVLARRNQLVPDIESALKLSEENGLPQKTSYFGVITGCSRTADIEKLLVIGAHGPKRLVVIVEG
jgi:L-lactate dehydrogenase complex protein LldG